MSIIPDSVKKEIRKIAQASHTPVKTIGIEFAKVYKSPFVQKDPQFKTPEERMSYSLSIVTMRFKDRKPVKPYDIIPAGIGSYRVSQAAGTAYTDLLVVIENRLRRIFFKKPEVLDNIMFDQVYREVELAQITDEPLGDLEGDERAKLNRPEYVPDFDLLKIENPPYEVDFSALIGNKSDVVNNWTILTDWRIIKGIISAKSSGTSKTGGKWGIYRVSNYGGGDCEHDNIPVWIAPRLMKYNIESICKFIGTIAVDNDGNPAMNAYRVEPIIAREV